MSTTETTDTDSRPEAPVELTPVQARQGLLGRPVLAVLVIGLLLAMMAWAAAEFWGMSIAPESTTVQDPAVAPAVDPTQPSGDVINDDPPADEKRQSEPVVIEPQPTGNQ